MIDYRDCLIEYDLLRVNARQPVVKTGGWR